GLAAPAGAVRPADGGRTGTEYLGVASTPSHRPPMQQPVLPAYLIARWLLLLVLLAGAYFLSGFLVPALAALIIGLATWPLYRRLVERCGGRTVPAATLALIGVILVLIIPL